MPTIAAQCAQLAEQAVRERRTHLGYLEALLQAELEEREQRLIERRIREARLPRLKTLNEFDFARNPKVSAQQIHELAKGDYIAKAEPVIFIGDSGTGKTHLLTGLAVAACRQKRRVRFATAAGLINEMVEAKHQLQLGRALSRWGRYDLIALDTCRWRQPKTCCQFHRSNAGIAMADSQIHTFTALFKCGTKIHTFTRFTAVLRLQPSRASETMPSRDGDLRRAQWCALRARKSSSTSHFRSQ
jgi:IstB-like ATP binding protein